MTTPPVHRRLMAPLRRVALEGGLYAAAAHRRRLDGVAFIGVTGSAGKTAAKDLIAAVLRTQGPGTRSAGSWNSYTAVGGVVLLTRARHAFCVAEVAAWERGSVARAAQVLQPTIAVVTNIGLDHRTAFRTRDGVASEKRALVDAVGAGGTAVLNADDPYTLGMAEGFKGRVVTFGRSPGAMLRAERISSSWPDRLSFTLCWNGRSVPVFTRLCGKHWVTSVLAAFGVALATGIPIEQAVDAVATVEPFDGRMSPVAQDGVTFIRDDWKAAEWNLDAVIDFLADARARRKILVIGTISEGSGRDPRRYSAVARRALAVADTVVFVGPKAKYAFGAKTHPRGEALHLHTSIRAAAQFVKAEVAEGDLVLVKGSNRADHLLRIVLAHRGEVQCWRSACGKQVFCDQCLLLHVPELRTARRQ